MACKIQVLASAKEEISAIVSYLARRLASPQAAKGFLEALDQQIIRIADNPLIYAPSHVPELAALNYRAALVGNYVLLYKLNANTVFVAHVFHQSQNYARLVLKGQEPQELQEPQEQSLASHENAQEPQGGSNQDSLFTIRDARPQDAALLDSYAAAAGMAPMPGLERIRVAVNGEDVPVGFCRLQNDVNGIAYVNPVVVYQPWQGYGVGRALVEDAAALAGELRLIARGENIGFYEKLGFAPFPWEEVDLVAASEDCDNCPRRDTCGPVPMRLSKFTEAYASATNS